ncbi:hypothetical protein AC578_6376 [Pseudocercospora eumusae]|uniref:Uncharacterized protein n=1 Tax=Pseudocercospora eumusae TaxID=321146 RepID=A0A139H0T9_9PEZI|nr:hypothetical protein AC578_6376 [Pseudocercospora eumusae]
MPQHSTALFSFHQIPFIPILIRLRPWTDKKMPKAKKSRKGRRPTRTTKGNHSTQPLIEHIEQNSKILQLPKELLTHILTFILTRDTLINLHSKSSRRWRTELATLNAFPCAGSAQKDRSLDILLVSKAFYFAGLEAFYSSNIFQFDSVTALTKLLNATHSDRRNCIQNIRLLQSCYTIMTNRESPEGMSLSELMGPETMPAGLAEQLPKLRRVSIRCEITGCYWYAGVKNEKERMMVRGMIQDVLRNAWEELPRSIVFETELVSEDGPP